MNLPALLASLASAASLVSSAAADSAWQDLAISAPRFGRPTRRELFHRLNKTSIDFYLSTRAEQGYNVVQTVVVSELNGTTRANFYGDLPFNNSDPTQPNEAYFELVDWTTELAASYGILLALVPTWGMYVNGGWHTTEPIFNETNARQWGNYIGARYPGLPKILGGDSNVLWAQNVSAAQDTFTADPTLDPVSLVGPIVDTASVWASMRAGLVEAEAALGHEAVVLYHPTNSWLVKPEVTPEPYAHVMLPNEADRVSINGVQSGHNIPDGSAGFTPLAGWDSTKNYECIAEMRDKFTGPVLDLENHYEGAHVGFDLAKPLWNASHIRTGLYHGVYSGAAGFTYGANSVWQLYEPRADLLRDSDWYPAQINQNASGSWRRDIFFEGATQIQHVTKPLQTLTMTELELLEPARELLASVNGTTSQAANTFEGTRYISVLASRLRDRYFAYTGHGDAFSLQLDNGSGAREGVARWFSPRDGQIYNESTVSVPTNNSTRVDFTAPSTGGVDHDWLLIVEF